MWFFITKYPCKKKLRTFGDLGTWKIEQIGKMKNMFFSGKMNKWKTEQKWNNGEPYGTI